MESHNVEIIEINENLPVMVDTFTTTGGECDWILQKGKNAGEECKRRCILDGTKCRYHYDKEVIETKTITLSDEFSETESNDGDIDDETDKVTMSHFDIILGIVKELKKDVLSMKDRLDKPNTLISEMKDDISKIRGEIKSDNDSISKLMDKNDSQNINVSIIDSKIKIQIGNKTINL